MTPVSPYGQSGGGQQRSRLLLAALKRLGEVDLCVLQRGDNAGVVVTQLSPEGVKLELGTSGLLGALRGGARAAVARGLPHPVANYDLVVSRYLWPTLQIDLPAQTPLIVDLDDVYYRFERASLWRPRYWRAMLQKCFVSLVARRRLARLAGAFFVSERDRAKTSARLPSMVLPNVPLPAPHDFARHADGRTILLVGSMWYGPNKDAADWFIAHVLPHLQVEQANVRLVIAGAAPQKQLRIWSQQAGVEALGYVDNLEVLYASAALVVVPVQAGGGSNIKLLEALAHACPCVASRFSHDALALHVKADVHLLVANSAKTFASACLRVLRDPLLGVRLGRAGQQCMTDHFTAERFMHDAATFAEKVVRRD